ncbi:hypothetical protein SD51_09635 [Alicyclobacillus tengchongensis]|nr:hypothetical protein SD51_09635 [Alicyclobacillus tengchongensis]
MANRLCELCTLYALGGLDKEEVLPFGRHLATCPDCQEELASLRGVTDALSFDFDFVSPPPGMRERVLTAVFANQPDSQLGPEVTGATQRNEVPTLPRDLEPLSVPKQRTSMPNASSGRRRYSLLWWVVSWASLVAIAGGLTWRGLGSTTSPVGRVQAEKQMESTSGVGSAHMWITTTTQGKELLIRFKGLKRTVGTEVYQVWLIQKGHAPQSAGIFAPDATGDALFAAWFPKQHVNVIAVTLEPKAVDQKPLGTMMFETQIST